MRQFVQDDKGCVGIGAFGVSGHSYIDNGVRAIRSALAMIEKFEAELNISCSIGIATGDAFCGLVGARHRCEWAMLGPSVNLALTTRSESEHFDKEFLCSSCYSCKVGI